jgi:hypothetical protein
MDKDPEALSDAKRLLEEWAKDRSSRTGSCLSLRRMQFSFSTVSLVKRKLEMPTLTYPVSRTKSEI